MINKVIILGRVGSDPEVKVSAREEKFAGMSVATSEKYKNNKVSGKRKLNGTELFVGIQMLQQLLKSLYAKELLYTLKVK